MGIFNVSNRFSDKTIEKPKAKVILGVTTGALWILSALLMFIDAFLFDLAHVVQGKLISSDLVTIVVGPLLPPIYNQIFFTIHLITLFLNILGIISAIAIGLAIRANSNSFKWKFILFSGICEIFLFSLAITILKTYYFGIASSVLALLSVIFTLISGILFFTVLPIEDIKAGIILVATPLMYLGVAIAIVLLILFLITSLYKWIL